MGGGGGWGHIRGCARFGLVRQVHRCMGVACMDMDCKLTTKKLPAGNFLLQLDFICGQARSHGGGGGGGEHVPLLNKT